MGERFPIRLTVEAEEAGKRLDRFLVARLGDASRARVQRLISEQKVRADGKVVKASLRLKDQQRIEILEAVRLPPLRATAEDIPLDVVYEDESLAVVNKPAGMMVHAGAGATDDARNRGTLVNALLYRFGALSAAGGALRPGLVHRLDRGTSGLMVIAKTDESHRRLAEQFARRKAKKTYIALVHGWVNEGQGKIDINVGRDLARRTRMTTRQWGGREAITRYQVQRRLDTPYGKFSLLKIKIDTGRTHQIRVHMASIGHPVVGDTLYGAPGRLQPKPVKSPGTRPSGKPPFLSRNFLHAAELEISHPASGEVLCFSRPLPPELQQFLHELEQKD